MINYRKIIVFDFETDDSDATTCNPTQLAAIVLNARTLKEVNGGRFEIKIKPEGIEGEGYLNEDREKCLKWHCKQRGLSKEVILDEWKNSCDEKTAWLQFSSFVNSFNTKNNAFFAPIAGGMNITKFDLPIAKRLNEKYKIKTMFFERDKIDILDLCFLWFESYEDSPSNYRMDTLREYFGLSTENAHDALVDVEQEALIIKKFLQLHRRITSGKCGQITFRNAFK